ncbi:MAG: TSUP family transporter [Chloroherpetonaceae bacterium]|nr:TSUP family transporter [Chloroherpetonaceae bacterium]MDW8436520.1 TSUP family transporter [Chloroherpetonaceae bacterium]
MESFALDALPLCAFAFLAGFIDSIAGGGGLIQLPALFIFSPLDEHATIFGTNKLSSICGTSVATAQYARRVELDWRVALWTAGFAFVFSFLGARVVSLVPKDWIRPIVFVLLVVVGVYVAAKKDFGANRSPKLTGWKSTLCAALLGAGIGFYDGFFGPGTGSFLIVAFIGIFGCDFLRASAMAKAVNFSTNFAALCYFAPAGHVIVSLGLAMGAFNVLGSILGSRLALLKGSAFVRGAFLLVIAATILKFALDAFDAS